MSKKKTSTTQQPTEQEKPKTKYDRKMEARRKEAMRQKQEALIFRIICIVILTAIIGTAGYFGITAYMDFHTATTETYVTIGDHELTQVEYDYHYNTTVNNYISTYSYYLSYIGLDTTKPFDEQNYSEEMTWQEYFEQTTLEQLRQTYALLDDAKANNYEYDTTADYDSFLANAKETAQTNKITMWNYYKSMFGEYATANNIRPFLENDYFANAYYDKLLEDNTPAEDVCKDYYEEHKEDYDKVSYYSFSFDPANYTENSATEPDTDTTTNDGTEDTEPEDTDNTEDTNTEDTDNTEDTNTEDTDSAEDANTEDTEDTDNTEDTNTEDTDNTEDTNTEDTDTSRNTARTLAEEMKERLEDGKDFETLCTEYAVGDAKANYESTDTEYSLTSDIVCSSVNQTFRDWIADESRKAGDITMIQAEESGICYVLKFVNRTYDENCLESISSTLASDAVSEYMDGLLEDKYEIKDVAGKISYLNKQAEEDQSENTDDNDSSDTESLLNTSILN